MICSYKKSLIAFICPAFIFLTLNVGAQVSLIQNTIDKVNSYKNLSYQSINRLKELTTRDTITTRRNSLFVKVPEDKNFGYLFNIETQEEDKPPYTDLYNGQNLVHTIRKDSTYEIQKDLSFDIQSTLSGSLQWIRGRLEKYPSKVIQAKDTTINTMNSRHLIATVWDTVIDKERCYTDVHFFIDGSSGLPDLIIVKSRNKMFGDKISDYYSETRYFDYKVDQQDIGIASITIPTGFHPQETELPGVRLELLPVGTAAPGWVLYDEKDKKISLAELKGKIVLMDFFFIGCGGCMQSLTPLNKLHEKYKNENVEIISMTFRDSKKAVTAFKEDYNIKYPVYINANGVVKLYNVEGFPTFYFIGKEGKIANVLVGYDDDFEKKAIAVIDKLLYE